MMKTIVEEKLISFKSLEQKIYKYICEYRAMLTRSLLEMYDDRLAEGRDKKAYRDKGKRSTTVKTVYGEVSCSRRVYERQTGEGKKEYGVPSGRSHADGEDRPDVSEPGGGEPVPRDGRGHKQHLWAEREPWRCMDQRALRP